MATLLDTSALIVLIRRRRPARFQAVADAARADLEGGRALVSVVTAAELLVGARDARARDRVTRLMEHVPVVDAGREIGLLAGRMGAAARAAGHTVPLSDLLIAATATWLDLPLLTCDSDFGRGVEATGEGAWSSLRLHSASEV